VLWIRIRNRIRTTGALVVYTQRPTQHLDVSKLHGPELHLDAPKQPEPVLVLDVPTLQGPKLHLDVSTLQGRAAPGKKHI
jgi:hypothetical protein